MDQLENEFRPSSAFLDALPWEIVQKCGHLWSRAERDRILEIIFAPGASVAPKPLASEDRLEDESLDRVRNGNFLRLFAYIAGQVEEAPSQEIEDAMAECCVQVWRDGDFLAEVRQGSGCPVFIRSRQDFVSWFQANLPKAAAVVRVAVAKQFEQPVACLKQQPLPPKFERSVEPLAVWLSRVIEERAKERRHRRLFRWGAFLRQVERLDAAQPFNPEAQAFHAWFLDSAQAEIWAQLARYERRCPFAAESVALDEWLVGALLSLPEPAVLLRGYKAFDTQRGTFDQWFHGVVVGRVVQALRRRLARRTDDSWDERTEGGAELGDPVELQDACELEEGRAFGGLAREVLESTLHFCEGLAPPLVSQRRATAFARYARVIRLRRCREISYAAVADALGESEDYARMLMSRGTECFFTFLGLATDVAAVVAYASSVAGRSATREEKERLQRSVPALLAVYVEQPCPTHPPGDAAVGEAASRLGVTPAKIRELAREAWKVILMVLDADGTGIHRFSLSKVRVTASAALNL